MRQFIVPTLFGLFVLMYSNRYEEGFRDGFVEGEAHQHRMHEVQWRARQDWIEELERICADRCAQHGHPSLNAFYSIDRDACMCQEQGASDDTHGFLILRER